jgi:type IV pilus assembly protein PilY1
MLTQQKKLDKNLSTNVNCRRLMLSKKKIQKFKVRQNNVSRVVQLCLFFYSASLCSAQIPEVLFYEKPLYTFGGVTPHINMPLSVEYTVTGAAWSYPRVNGIVKYVGNDKKEIYLGYFNYKLCYNYNTTSKYFYPNGALTDDTYECSTGLSGNFLNWASLTTLDLIRYALTGGGRDVDEPSLTVLKRANIPTIDASLFPLKQYKSTYIKSCKNKIYFDSRKSDLDSNDCNVLDNNASSQYEVRVQVCNDLDANLRSDFCKKYPSSGYKPTGVLQRNNNSNRFSLLSYLNLNSSITNIFSNNYVQPQSGSWDNDLYTYMWGGVLRAPAKFLGRYRYDTNLDFIPNVQREWNEYDGTLVLDANHERVNTKIQARSVDNIALSDKTGQTVKGNERTENGVSIVNYINQFGLDGEYRIQDPLSELLGESLRYLGNYNAPTNLASMLLLDQSTTRNPLHIYKRILNELSGSNEKNALYLHLDKFPIVTDWNWKDNGVDEPIRGECEKNNANLITFADTNSWRDIYKDLPSWKATAIDDSPSNPFFNGKSIVQLLDSIDPKLQHMATTLLPLSLASRDLMGDKVNPYIISALIKGAYQDGIKYQNPSFSDVPVVQKVRSVVLDVGEKAGMFTADDCHLYTAGIYGTHTQSEISKLLLRSNCSTFADARENLTTSNSNGSINSNAISSFNNLLPSKGYFFPLDSNNIIDNIQQGFRIPSEASGNISAGIVQNAGFVNGVQQIYLFRNNLVTTPSNVDTSISTELKKYKLSVDSDGDVVTSEDSQTRAWESTLKSSLRNYTETSSGRNIILGGAPKLESNNQNRTSPLYFTYGAISAEENQPLQESDAFNALSIGLPQKDANNQGLEEMIKKRISYIRGNAENEQTDTSKNMFRKRNFMLGSTANSIPVYSAETNVAGRNMLYLASNDGMMHGIDADSGSEMFGFIPRNILSSLYDHGEQGYIDKPLIESSPTIKTIVPISTTTAEKTVLVSGMGAGARGLFAIDVTPLSTTQNNITKSNILFEFTERDDKYIGNILGQPEFVSLKTGTTTITGGKSIDVIETFVAVSSGYNNLNDTTVFDTNGQASNQTYLYLLKTNKPYAEKWVEGSNYYRIKISDGIVNNGLSSPAAFSNNSLTQYVYVGDLQGSLWRLDFKGVLGVTRPTPKEVFSTKNNSTLMPITAKPVITYAPTGGLMVIFGTGRYFGLNDLGSLQKNQQVLVSFNDVDFSSSQVQTYNLLNLNAREISNGASTPVTTDSRNAKGWYIKLPNSLSQGERMITPVKVLDGVVLFTTQNLGQFTNKLCGETKGATASVRLENGLDGSYSSKSKFIGHLLSLPIILPPTAFESDNIIGVAGNYVYRKEYNSEINFTVGSATNKAETATYYFEKAIGKYKSGVVSWREIIDVKAPI